MCSAVARSHRSSLTTVLSTTLAGLLVAVMPLAIPADDGQLQRLRDDVRNGPPSSNGGESAPRSDERPARNTDDDASQSTDDDGGGVQAGLAEALGVAYLANGAIHLAGLAVTSPIWGPIGILEHDYSAEAHFPRFPYDDVPGYLTTDPYSLVNRRWAARLSGEYREPFDDIQIVGGRLLVSTTSRFGLDTQWDYWQEHRADDSHDQLWSGDCNLVFRFAQGEHAEFRTGLGFNWLDDRQQTDFGFNFTYGFDVFPCRPWVVSAEFDAGTLGKAGLFRARTTVGVVVHGVEAYTGYEYFDVGRTHLNCLVAGLRIWF